MPRVTPLTKEQKERKTITDFYKSLLDGMNMERGRSRQSNDEFSKRIGVSRTTWRRWNNDGLADAEFGNVVAAAVRAGLTLKVEMNI